jgi:hypothetical protein
MANKNLQTAIDVRADIQRLQQKIDELTDENNILKSLLENAGISYHRYLQGSSQKAELDPDQGSRILPHEVTRRDASLFFSMFWGRMDVYSLRVENAKTGVSGYYPQCNNFWRYGCPKRNHEKIKCSDCPNRSFKRLTVQDVEKHLSGWDGDRPFVIGVYPLYPGDTCRFLVFDFDNHERGAEKKDFANDDNTWKEEVESLRKICEINGIDALTERSRSGRGAHLWLFFEKPVDAGMARKFGFKLLDKGAESVNLKSFQYYDRMLPAQDHLPEGRLGNLIALPLQGMALKNGNSAFVDEHWNAYPDQWKVLLSKKKLSFSFIEEKLNEWDHVSGVVSQQSENEDAHTEKPWDRNRKFQPEDVRDS